MLGVTWRKRVITIAVFGTNFSITSLDNNFAFLVLGNSNSIVLRLPLSIEKLSVF